MKAYVTLLPCTGANVRYGCKDYSMEILDASVDTNLPEELRLADEVTGFMKAICAV
jgi:hypothetical protein